MNPPTHEKARVLLDCLERGHVNVHLDSRRERVVVPQHLRSRAQLVLCVGYKLQIPMAGFLVDDDGICVTLSFNRQPFPCVIPWSSVYALVCQDGRTHAWREDVPNEFFVAGEA